MKIRTQEEIDHIRLAFSSNGKPGVIETIVRRELEISSETMEPEILKACFVLHHCDNVAKLVDAIIAADIQSIGSASIDFLGVADAPFSIGNAMSLQEIRIGSRNHTPLQWLTALSKGFQELSLEQKKAFDEICQNLHSFHTAKVTDMEIVDEED